jgi:hypothetical protein
MKLANLLHLRLDHFDDGVAIGRFEWKRPRRFFASPSSAPCIDRIERVEPGAKLIAMFGGVADVARKEQTLRRVKSFTEIS